MKLLRSLFFGLFIFSKAFAADWIAYAADISNFQIETLNLMTEVAGTPIAAGRSVGLAVSPDALRLYVINRNVTSSVSVIDLSTQTVIETIFLNDGGVDQQPFAIAITPDATTAYITALDSSNNATLLKLDLGTSTYTVIPILPNVQADAIAISPDATMLYVTQTAAVVGMTIPGNGFQAPINIPGRSTRIAVSANGLYAYVTDMINHRLYEIDLSTNIISQTIPLTAGSQPTNIAVSANGQWVYVANENVNFATAIDLLNSYMVTDIPLGPLPGNYSQQGVAISPDSQKVVFTHSNINQFSVVPVESMLVTNISTLGNPGFVSITPDQAPVASFNAEIAAPFFPSTFTSVSTTSVGSITSYLWDFGDGNTLSTNMNPVQHTYVNGGLYNVTLTVTNSAGTSIFQTFTGQTVSNNGGPSASITEQINVPFPTSVIEPPSDTQGYQTKNTFLTQTEYVNVIQWKAPQTGINPVAYRIYGDSNLSDLIAVVAASGPEQSYAIHNQKKGVFSYFIVSVGPNGEVSTAAEVFIK